MACICWDVTGFQYVSVCDCVYHRMSPLTFYFKAHLYLRLWLDYLIYHIIKTINMRQQKLRMQLSSSSSTWNRLKYLATLGEMGYWIRSPLCVKLPHTYFSHVAAVYENMKPFSVTEPQYKWENIELKWENSIIIIAQEMQVRNSKWVQYMLKMLAFFNLLKDNYIANIIQFLLLFPSRRI